MALTRQILHWHEHPAVIAWWRARWGWALRWLTPRRRRVILATVTVWLGVRHLLEAAAAAPSFATSTDWVASALVTVTVFGFLWLCYVAAARLASLPGIVRRHPLISLHLLFWGLLLILWSTTSDAGGWRTVSLGVAMILPLLLWRLGYLLLSGQRGKVAGTRFTDHLIYLLPLHAGGYGDTPFGKGLDYLARHEAQDEEALARAQLAGIKLVLLAFLWMAVLAAMYGLVYGVPNRVNRALSAIVVAPLLPGFGELLAQGANAPRWHSWVSLYVELVRQVLQLAIVGHLGVGVMRIFGFSIFRNTYKPLLAETLLQFWSRYFFYFKELLVDFFFLPTFAKWFRKWPAIRMFAAVFAAAFVGNMYGYIILPRELVLGGLVEAIWALRSRFFYCLLLALGIFISMRREQRRAGRALPSSITHRCVRLFLVWTFFALIRIWDHYAEVGFLTRTQFFLGLFGLA